MKTYTKEMLSNLISHYNEVRVNGKGEGNSIDLGIADSCADFAIQRLEYDKFKIANDSPEPLYVDSCQLPGGSQFEVSKSCMFIYGHQSSSKENTDFLFGFDPNQKDLWRLNPQENRGLEIRAENFTKTFRKRGKLLGIEDINFTIRPSEFVGIYGGSGTGKTTLLESMIAPAEKETLGYRIRKKFFPGKSITKGKILFDDQDISFYSMEVAYLPQNIDLPQELKCKDLLKLAMLDRGERQVINSTDAIGKTLTLCTLDDSILEMRCGDLSGGQRRRLALAMALLKKNVRLLVLDEPTTGLDIENEILVMNTLKRLSRHGITVVTVTHSIAACRLFDRVLILRKTDSDHGAELCFKSMWTEESFNKVLKEMKSDAERISFLANPNSGLLLRGLKCDAEYVWPYQAKNLQDQKDSEIKNSFFAYIKKALSNFFSRTTWWQFGMWLKTGLKLISKDRKSIKAFFLLSVCCALIIQLGIVKQGGDADCQLISMFIICAPWLCATYAAIFLTDSLRFFAWERFSGLCTRNFIVGVFLAQIIPALLIALVFSVSVYKRINHETASRKLLYLADRIFEWKPPRWIKHLVPSSKNGGIETKDKIISRTEDKPKDMAITPIENKKVITRFLDRFMKEKQAQECVDHLNESNQGTCFRSPLEQTDDDFPSLGKKQYSFIPPPAFYKVFLSMLFICMTGAALGIFAGALFLKAKSATVFLVVLFIFFLLFGRLFAPSYERCMEPISLLYNGPFPEDIYKLSEYQTNEILPWMISYISISRYAFSIVVYPVVQKIIWDFILLFCFLFFALCLAIHSLSNKSKIWKILSPR